MLFLIIQHQFFKIHVCHFYVNISFVKPMLMLLLSMLVLSTSVNNWCWKYLITNVKILFSSNGSRYRAQLSRLFLNTLKHKLKRKEKKMKVGGSGREVDLNGENDTWKKRRWTMRVTVVTVVTGDGNDSNWQWWRQWELMASDGGDQGGHSWGEWWATLVKEFGRLSSGQKGFRVLI